jgi:hypothetical protein
MYTAEQIVETIKRRQADAWDTLHAGNDPAYDFTPAQAIVREYDELLIAIGAIRPEEAKNA